MKSETRMRIAISFFVLGAGALLAQPVAYDLGPVFGSRFTLTVEKTGIWSGRKHVFEFERYSGRLRFDRNAPTQSQVELAIDAASVICRDTWVDEKDRARILAFALHDMLDAERHPRLMFRSTGIVLKGEHIFEAVGILSVRGIEKPATVTVVIDDRGGEPASLTGQAIVRLKDYGLKPPKAALGAIGTKDEMTVEFRLVPRLPHDTASTVLPERALR
jgi:polyisoprenoid-binding protein YceI